MSFRFGIASEISIEKSTVAFCGTILFLVTFESVTHRLEYFIGNSPTYNKMLQRIYKELMINGFVSFALSMYMAFYPKSSHSEWIHVMEFCGYVLFFVSIFFVAHGLYIIGLSLFSAKQYDIYHSTPISEILQRITTAQQTWKESLFDFRYLPFSSLRSVAEFKIIYALFRDTYWLPSNFDYGSYLSGCFERYSLRIVQIGKFSWAFMFFLGVLNYLRVKYFGPHAFNCKGFKTADGISHGGGHGGGGAHSVSGNYSQEEPSHEELGGRYGITHACADEHLQLFFACGLVVTLYVLAVYLVGRTYVIRLISHSGVTEIRDYGEFLALEESACLKSEDVRTFEINVDGGGGADGTTRPSPTTPRSRRMSINTLRHNLDRAVSQNESEKSHGHGSSGGTFFTSVWETLSNSWSGRVRPVVPSVPLQFSPRPSVVSMNSPSLPNPLSPASSLTGRVGPPGTRRASLVVTLDRSADGNSISGIETLSSIEQFKLTKRTRTSQRNSGSGSNLMIDAFRRVTNLVDPSAGSAGSGSEPTMKLSEDFSHIYLFRSPDLYYAAVECCIVLNSLYLSLWMTNYITVVHYETNSTAFWQILMMCPLFIVMPLVGEIVKTASMLSAIAELEIDIMGSVLERMEDHKLLLDQLRTSAKRRLGVTGTALRELLENLFNTIDYNHKGYLNKGDIREFFRALHFHYSNEKFNRLFFVIDHNRDGEISFNELYRLLCPDEVEEEDRKIRTEAVTKMKEVARVKPTQPQQKGGVSRLRSLMSGSVEPLPEGDEGPSAPVPVSESNSAEPRKTISWKWFSSGDGNRSKSDKDISLLTIAPQESKSSEVLELGGDRLFSPAMAAAHPLHHIHRPQIEMAEQQRKEEGEEEEGEEEEGDDEDSVVKMEEIRDPHSPETHSPQSQQHRQSHQHQSSQSPQGQQQGSLQGSRTGTGGEGQGEEEDDIEIVELGAGDELV